MWIWQLPRTERGDLAAIAARARGAGMSTVFVKSADGTTVLGPVHPAARAGPAHRRPARLRLAVRLRDRGPRRRRAPQSPPATAGADCLVTDAESHYEGRYAAASRYVATLRAAIGPDFRWA